MDTNVDCADRKRKTREAVAKHRRKKKEKEKELDAEYNMLQKQNEEMRIQNEKMKLLQTQLHEILEKTHNNTLTRDDILFVLRSEYLKSQLSQEIQEMLQQRLLLI